MPTETFFENLFPNTLRIALKANLLSTKYFCSSIFNVNKYFEWDEASDEFHFLSITIINQSHNRRVNSHGTRTSFLHLKLICNFFPVHMLVYNLCKQFSPAETDRVDLSWSVCQLFPSLRRLFKTFLFLTHIQTFSLVFSKNISTFYYSTRKNVFNEFFSSLFSWNFALEWGNDPRWFGFFLEKS